MGLFNFKSAISNIFTQPPPTTSDLFPAEKALLSNISRINASGGDITPELYQQLRDYEMNWLERHYDFNSIEGINSIPVTRDLPGAPAPGHTMKGHTGEVYYYLRHKAYKHEESGRMDLALACMQKSVSLVKCRSYYTSDDCYPLVKMLARAGFIEDAYREKYLTDQAFGSAAEPDAIIEREAKRGAEARDFQWLQIVFPDKCPKSISSFRRMKTQNTKNFQVLQSLAAEKGRTI